MLTNARHLGFVAAVVGAVLGFKSTAAGQTIILPHTARPPATFNPNPQIAPGVSLLNYAHTTAVLGRAYSQVPPYMLGYNPYPQAVNFGSQFSPSAYGNPYAGGGYGGVPYGGGYGGYGGAPYAGGYSAGGVDPLAGGYGAYGGNPYYPYGGGYGIPPDAADVLAYGQLGLDQEKARILREISNQARLDTRKKIIDTMAYIRANEYTFTKEQQDIAKRLLDRLQKTPTQAEVQSGKSLNVLLADLVQFNYKQVRAPTITLDEDVLKLVNISGSASSGNIGLLRDNGQFVWPAAFDEKDIITEKDRKDLDLQAKQLYEQAGISQPDANMLRNVESSLRTLRANLTKQVNNLPGPSYLEAQRFLDNFDAAMLAVKKGDVVLNLDYQQKFVKGGKTVQELVEYMGNKGLRFAPASAGSERAYDALQAALATHSRTIHDQVALAGKNN